MNIDQIALEVAEVTLNNRLVHEPNIIKFVNQLLARLVAEGLYVEVGDAEPAGYFYKGHREFYHQIGDPINFPSGIPLYLHPQPQQASVPDGWQLVPKEPTVEMREQLQVMADVSFAATKPIYKAMLAAAPKPEDV